MRPKSIHGGYSCDVSIEPLQSETYTKGVTIRRDEYLSNNKVMKNLEAAKELLKKYKSVTLEELKQVFKDLQESQEDYDYIVDGGEVLNAITGFGEAYTCPLCKSVDEICEDCIYSFRIKERHTPCIDIIYSRICNSMNAEELYQYLQQRISYLSHVIEWCELNH